MKIQLIPVSAWTEKMAIDSNEKLEAIKHDGNQADDWKIYQSARRKPAILFNEKVRRFDPVFIHTDELLELELSVFNELFNDDLGLGGWRNINNAHYRLIDEALSKITNQGKRVLITFGTGHIGWLRNKLKARNDIALKELIDVL